MNRIKYTALAVMVLALGTTGWVLYQSFNATWVYTYRIQYATVPPTDDALTDWLKNQPGVAQVAVSREGNTIVVKYEMKGGHSTPDVVAKSKDFGYSDLHGLTEDIKGPW